MTDTPGLDDAIDAADAILWHDGKRPVTPRSDVISEAVVAACKVVTAATREAVAQEIEATRPHVPVSTDPKRRDSVVVRSTLNTAAGVARGAARDGKEQQQ